MLEFSFFQVLEFFVHFKQFLRLLLLRKWLLRVDETGQGVEFPLHAFYDDGAGLELVFGGDENFTEKVDVLALVFFVSVDPEET